MISGGIDVNLYFSIATVLREKDFTVNIIYVKDFNENPKVLLCKIPLEEMYSQPCQAFMELFSEKSSRLVTAYHKAFKGIWIHLYLDSTSYVRSRNVFTTLSGIYGAF